MKIAFNNLISLIATTFIYLMGGFDIALQCLLIIIFLDYITGILSAIYNKRLNSKIGIKGIVKKVGYLCLVALSVIIDKITGQTGIIRSIVIYFLVSNDGISIIENLVQMNVKVPKKIKESLEQIRKENK